MAMTAMTAMKGPQKPIEASLDHRMPHLRFQGSRERRPQARAAPGQALPLQNQYLPGPEIINSYPTRAAATAERIAALILDPPRLNPSSRRISTRSSSSVRSRVSEFNHRARATSSAVE